MGEAPVAVDEQQSQPVAQQRQLGHQQPVQTRQQPNAFMYSQAPFGGMFYPDGSTPMAGGLCAAGTKSVQLALLL